MSLENMSIAEIDTKIAELQAAKDAKKKAILKALREDVLARLQSENMSEDEFLEYCKARQYKDLKEPKKQAVSRTAGVEHLKESIKALSHVRT